MASFFSSFVHPIPSLGPNNDSFQRIWCAGTTTGFFFSTALESLKIPPFFLMKQLAGVQAKSSTDGGQAWETAVREVIFYKENDEWFQERN